MLFFYISSMHTEICQSLFVGFNVLLYRYLRFVFLCSPIVAVLVALFWQYYCCCCLETNEKIIKDEPAWKPIDEIAMKKKKKKINTGMICAPQWKMEGFSTRSTRASPPTKRSKRIEICSQCSVSFLSIFFRSGLPFCGCDSQRNDARIPFCNMLQIWMQHEQHNIYTIRCRANNL